MRPSVVDFGAQAGAGRRAYSRVEQQPEANDPNFRHQALGRCNEHSNIVRAQSIITIISQDENTPGERVGHRRLRRSTEVLVAFGRHVFRPCIVHLRVREHCRLNFDDKALLKKWGYHTHCGPRLPLKKTQPYPKTPRCANKMHDLRSRTQFTCPY